MDVVFLGDRPLASLQDWSPAQKAFPPGCAIVQMDNECATRGEASRDFSDRSSWVAHVIEGGDRKSAVDRSIWKRDALSGAAYDRVQGFLETSEGSPLQIKIRGLHVDVVIDVGPRHVIEPAIPAADLQQGPDALPACLKQLVERSEIDLPPYRLRVTIMNGPVDQAIRLVNPRRDPVRRSSVTVASGRFSDQTHGTILSPRAMSTSWMHLHRYSGRLRVMDRPAPRRRYCYVVYFFPPWGGVGAQWTVKLIKYLHRAGWRASVVTVRESAPWLIDQGASTDLPPDLAVRRAPNFDLPAKLMKQRIRRAESVERRAAQPSLRGIIVRLVRHIYDNYYVLEGQLPWLITATIAGLGPARESEVILATIRPPAAALVGVLLKGVTKRPLVLDYRDFWTQATTVPARGPRLAIEEWLERQALRASDHVVTSSQGVLDSLHEKFADIPFEGSVLPLGFDPDDALAPGEGDGRTLSIVYAGSFLATRSPEVFLRGVRRALDADPGLSQRLIIDFYGVFGGPGNEALVRELRLDGVVRVHGFVEHAQAVQLIRKADWLLLIIETLPNWNGQGKFTGAYTSKLFEYLGAGRPILALVPPSLAADLITTAHAGIALPNDDPSAVARAIAEIASGQHRGISAQRDEAIVREFGLDRIAKRLADVFDAVTDRAIRS